MEKLEKLNWNICINLETGFELTFQQYKINPQRLNNIITKEFLSYFEGQFKHRQQETKESIKKALQLIDLVFLLDWIYLKQLKE